MDKNLISVGKYNSIWNASGTKILRYTVEIFHSGLNEYKLLSAPEKNMLDTKINLQVSKWNQKWEILEEKRKVNEEKESSLEMANTRSQEANQLIDQIENLLIHTLNVDDTIDWNALKNFQEFDVEKPIKPTEPKLKEYPPAPIKPELKFGILDYIFAARKNKKIMELEEQHLISIENWNNENVIIEKANEDIIQSYNKEVILWEIDVVKWEEMKKNYYYDQEQLNAKIDEMKRDYLQNDPNSIVEYCDMVLNNSIYPDFISKNYELEYISDSKILVVEYELPPITNYPKIKEVKYMASKKEIKELYLSDNQIQKMFDNTCYNISLRTIHEIFESDVANAIEAVSFNGWVRSINKATGNEENNCILSIQVKKSEFENIDLSRVDPKTCFKNLKGVASSKLSTLTSIQPIIQINKYDKRFVDSYNVADDLDSTTNIAAMNWEDFEHLVRELFEKEFQANGGEVKVTQASRDGGVDAIAFDPDPIRGGKIVIQAKRYTNTVGVSAVRDLYGTVMNEGATKGILVSTADYGSDAYEFAKGKPLTLLNGSNLLFLLEKHGHHAKIDLKEAKRLNQEK